jgi:hypothetical protein
VTPVGSRASLNASDAQSIVSGWQFERGPNETKISSTPTHSDGRARELGIIHSYHGAIDEGAKDRHSAGGIATSKINSHVIVLLKGTARAR